MALPLLHSDEPTLKDKLGREDLVAEIATLAATSDPPLVLGVHGDWGSGKTSFMQQIRALLQDKHQKNVVTVWFEAWRYQNEPSPVVALLQEMRREFSKKEQIKGRIKKYSQAHIKRVQ
jgi:predicted KAP-like P-loop ATPase